MIKTAEQNQVVPAVIGIYDGQPIVGLSEPQIEMLARDSNTYKVSIRDLPLCRQRGGKGGTTVAATAWIAHKAGISVFATGGIGGVHRGHPHDISADLPVLASVPIIIVCAGAKSILDLPRTLEYLETAGVPVVGWHTPSFPSFYSTSSGLPVDYEIKSVIEVVQIFQRQREFQLNQGILLGVPVPSKDAIPNSIIEPLITQALQQAEEKGISGKAVTPFILTKMVQLSKNRTKRANESLLINNVIVASKIARQMV
jgi:pseudouridine-5'-phosphate glycosidase